MAGPRARARSLVLLVAVLFARGTVALPVEEPPVEGSVPDLVAKLDPARPDPVRLQAVLLLGQLGGDAALHAVARALEQDGYPPVRSSAALALGQSGDVRWVRALAGGLGDDTPLVRKAARVAVKSLVQAFRDQKERLARYTYRVEVRGLRDRTGADNNDLTVWFQEGVAESLAREPRVTLGETLDFELDPAGDSEPSTGLLTGPLTGPARGPSKGPSTGVAADVELHVDGGVLEYELRRDASGTRALIRGDMQVFLEPVHEPVSERREGIREELLPDDASEEEAIEATALPLSRELFHEIWAELR